MDEEISSTTLILNDNKTKVTDVKSRAKKVKELKQILVKNRFVFLDDGISRNVYVSETESIVVKIETYDYGSTNQNKDEIETWENISLKIKEFLVPILAYAEDYSWIIMPYAKRPSWEEYEDLKLDLKRKHIYCSDLGRRNTGIYNGKACILDYGIEDW